MGAMYIRRKPRVKLEPLFSGGGQERGMRSGTLSPALCVGMGTAARLCLEDMHHDTEWVTFLSNKLRE
jgi:cysteine desulfurase